MLSKLIGICGKARHGKGEVAAILVEQGFTEVQFSAPVKELLLHMDPLVHTSPLTGEVVGSGDDVSLISDLLAEQHYPRAYTLEEIKTLPDVRRLLQGLGNGAREIVSPRTWVNGFLHRHLDALLADTKLVISDMRYPNEAEMIRELGGEVWKVVRATRGDRYEREDGTWTELIPFDNGLGELNSNASETAVDQIQPDLTILNDGGLKDLRYKVRRYLVERAFA